MQIKKIGHFIFNKKSIPYIFLLPSLSGVIIFSLIPFIDSMRRAFFDAVGKKFRGIDNFKRVLENDAFKLAAYNTSKFTVICIPLLLIISLILSVLIYNLKKDSQFIKASYLIPMSIPVASIVLLWKAVFSDNGLLNKYILFFDKAPVNWLNSKNTFVVLVVTYIWKNCGYDMILWLAGLGGINKELYEAAALDGCTKFQTFIYIIMPNLKITLFTVCTLSIINSFKVFREAYLICGNYPNDSIYMLQHLFNNWFLSLDVQKMCAGAVLITIAVLLIVLSLQKFCEGE